jgi:hypothetical protein
MFAIGGTVGIGVTAVVLEFVGVILRVRFPMRAASIAMAVTVPTMLMMKAYSVYTTNKIKSKALNPPCLKG